jgi:thiol-disulfide isomerase/thioredoxin
MARRPARCFAAILPGAGHAGFLPMKTFPLSRAARLLGLALLPMLALAAENAAFFSTLSFDAAREKAAAENKIVFIDFYTTWCGPCKELDATTWRDAAVVALLTEKVVSLKIDAEKERDLARRYKVNAYPTLLLIKPDGTEIDRLVGYRNAAKFTEEFSAGLAGKTALQRARDAVTNAANEHDRVQARYRLGNELARSDRPDEALVEYLWCFDEGMVQVRSFTGVRVSFLLGSLGRLAAVHPPAKSALMERRDRAKAAFLAGDPSEALDLAALNDAVHESAANLEILDSLPAADPRRSPFVQRLFSQLLTAKRYPDLVGELSGGKMQRQWQNMQQLANRPGQKLPQQAETEKKLARQWLAARIEVLAGAGQTADASTWIKTALEFENSDTMKSLLRQHLSRAGHPELLPE